MIPEEWRPIKGYEGLYEVSSVGRVKRLGRKTVTSSGKVRYLKETIRKPQKDIKGYLNLRLSNNGTYKFCRIHRLVAEAFIPNPNNKPQVNHINEDRADNRVDNLEWVTCTENNNHGSRNEKIAKIQRKPVEGMSLKDNSILKYKQLKDTKLDGFNHLMVSRCCRGIQYKHRGYIWRFITEEEIYNE